MAAQRPGQAMTATRQKVAEVALYAPVKPVMTAYRQAALALAAALRGGPARPRDLRAITPDAAAILYRNVYGWFDHPAPGRYALAAPGQAALTAWLAEAPQPG